MMPFALSSERYSMSRQPHSSSPETPPSDSSSLRIYDPGDGAQESPIARAVREVEEEVMAEFADRFERSGWLGRLILNYRMKLVIEERFEKLRPRLGWLLRQDFRHDANQVQLHLHGVSDCPDNSHA